MVEAATQPTHRQTSSQALLDKIVVAMAVMAPEIDAMEQELRLKAMEIFGVMIDDVLADQAREGMEVNHV